MDEKTTEFATLTGVGPSYGTSERHTTTCTLFTNGQNAAFMTRF